jgi:hypothetical protein
MKRYSWVWLAFLPLLAGCPPRKQAQEPPRDYEGVRQRANQAADGVDVEPQDP